jgi:hypothetical protein
LKHRFLIPDDRDEREGGGQHKVAAAKEDERAYAEPRGGCGEGFASGGSLLLV